MKKLKEAVNEIKYGSILTINKEESKPFCFGYK